MARRVVIVDDHPAFRRQASSFLEAAGFLIIGEAPTGASGIAVARAVRPDVVLDIGLPDMSGFRVAQQLASLPVPPAVVLTSSRDATDYGGRIEQSPVVGFIPKAELSGAVLTRLLDKAR